ncbi:MAG: V-type ATP synthase subunit E [Clostridia bacterium]|nr:V-type ATP synthase subunit E [Clostridia bacterium]
MPETVSKTDNFLKAIEKYAEEQRTRIQSEAEDFKEKELNKAEEEGLREAYVLIQKEMTDINTEISAELSRAENASRKKTFVRRQEIEAEVFEDAKKRLLEFTKTNDYIKSLERSAKLIAEKLDSDDAVLVLSERDISLKDSVSKAFGRRRKCEIRTSADIQIGGLIGQSRSLGILIDETLDTKLSEQHEWFCENSGLKVTE